MTIAGRFQPLEAARSGFAQRARDLQTAQTVLLREVQLPSEDGRTRLARAQAAKGIFHPSLVTLFDVVSLADDRVLLAYEFVPAQSLALTIGGHAFNLRRAATVVSEIADAVAELHARDFAHGGIALTTVLLTMKGKAKLDRVGDPSFPASGVPEPAGDLAALGDLLAELVDSRAARGIVGQQGIAALVARARSGRFESAATFAAMLRRLGA